MLLTLTYNSPSQKRLIASQLKPQKGKDIKWILIENIYSIFIQKITQKKTLHVFNQYPFKIFTQFSSYCTGHKIKNTHILLQISNLPLLNCFMISSLGKQQPPFVILIAVFMQLKHLPYSSKNSMSSTPKLACIERASILG